MNQFGRRLRVAIAGESHGAGIGVLVDGLPPGLAVDPARVQARLDTRRPGGDAVRGGGVGHGGDTGRGGGVGRGGGAGGGGRGGLVSPRREEDRAEFRSGVYRGRTTGAPILVWIPNQDARPQDHDTDLPRPGHADMTEHIWSGGHNDPRGGGHASGRLTACLVAAAAFAEQLLASEGIVVGAHLHRVGGVAHPDTQPPAAARLQEVEADDVPTVHEAGPIREAIEAARRAGDSIGGVVAWRADGVPPALGDPWMDSVESLVSHILFAVPGVKAVAFGAGTAASEMMGSQHNDPWTMDDDDAAPGPTTRTNHSGGILGGRTTGSPLWGHVFLKPTPSIRVAQATVSLSSGTPSPLRVRGRHDPCIALRATPVVRAAVELALADLVLLGRQQGHLPFRS